MSSNGGFPPLKIIKKDNDNSKKISDKKDRFFTEKKIVNINNIIKEVKKPMINMNKDEIKIIDLFYL